MNKAKLYNRSNILQRRDAESVIDEFGHLLQSSSSYSSTTSSTSSSSSDEEDTEGLLIEDNSSLPARLLDIGTGSGDVLVDFVLPLFSNGQLVGSDISEEMIRFGREHYAELENVDFDCLDISGDVQPFLRTHKPFDHVTSFYCLHWIQNQQLAMRNIYSLLKPNGNCLMAFIANMAIFDIYEEMAQTKKWSKFMHDVDLYVSPYQHKKDPADHARNLLAETGFQDILVESKQLTFHYNGIPHLKKAVKAVNPFMKRMIEEDQEDYLDDYVRYTMKYGLWENPEDGEQNIKIRVDYTLLVVYARK